MMTNPSTEYPQTISLLSEEDYVEDGMTEAGRDLKRCADFLDRKSTRLNSSH